MTFEAYKTMCNEIITKTKRKMISVFIVLFLVFGIFNIYQGDTGIGIYYIFAGLGFGLLVKFLYDRQIKKVARR